MVWFVEISDCLVFIYNQNIVYNIGFLLQLTVVASPAWVYSPLPELPFGIAMPEGGSVIISGGMFHVCLEVKNVSRAGLAENIVDRLREIKNNTENIMDLLPDDFPTILPPDLFPTLPTFPTRPTSRPTLTPTFSLPTIRPPESTLETTTRPRPTIIPPIFDQIQGRVNNQFLYQLFIYLIPP